MWQLSSKQVIFAHVHSSLKHSRAGADPGFFLGGDSTHLPYATKKKNRKISATESQQLESLVKSPLIRNHNDCFGCQMILKFPIVFIPL